MRSSLCNYVAARWLKASRINRGVELGSCTRGRRVPEGKNTLPTKKSMISQPIKRWDESEVTPIQCRNETASVRKITPQRRRKLLSCSWSIGIEIRWHNQEVHGQGHTVLYVGLPLKKALHRNAHVEPASKPAVDVPRGPPSVWFQSSQHSPQ